MLKLKITNLLSKYLKTVFDLLEKRKLTKINNNWVLIMEKKILKIEDIKENTVDEVFNIKNK